MATTRAQAGPARTVEADGTAPALTRYAGLRADGPLFRPMSELAAVLRGHGVDVVPGTARVGATLLSRCAEALRESAASTVLHVEAHGTWTDRVAPALPTQAGPRDRDATEPVRLLAPGLLVVGASRGGHARVAAALARVFAPGTLLLGSDAPTTRDQLVDVLRPVLLAGFAAPADVARDAMRAALTAAQQDQADPHWHLTTVAAAVHPGGTR